MTTSNKKSSLGLTGLLLFFLFLIALPSLAAEDINQKILDLRKQIEELTKQAELYKKNVNQKQKEANTLASQISILTNQIFKLQTQIVITGHQISSAKLEIGDLENKIFDAQEKINRERRAIGQLIGLIAERDRTSLTAILLKNKRLSDLANLVQQEQNLSQRLNDLIVSLNQTKDQLQTDKSALEGKKRNLEDLNTQQTRQKDSASQTKISKDQLLVQTKGKEQEYQKLLDETDKKKEAFFSELKSLESAALQSGAFIVHVTAKNVPRRGSKVFRWPENDYYITQSYGITKYSKRGAYGGAPHNGLDIASGYGSPIKSAADGKILASGNNNGWGNWVAVYHEPWGLVTLYAHMNAPSGLANGTVVTIGAVIGYEGATGNATGSHLHFSVYADFFTYLNPKNGQLYFNYFEGSLNPLDYL